MRTLAGISRRHMLSTVGCGFGLLGLRGVCEAIENPFAPKQPHFTAKAKRVIFLFMNGGMSQVDTFDPKPMLTRYHGQPMPGGAPKTERKNREPHAFAIRVPPLRAEWYGDQRDLPSARRSRR